MTLTYGRDSNDNVVPLLLDANGNVIVSVSQLTTTGGKIKVDSSGRMIVTADEPNAINPIGISASVTNLNLSAGTNIITIYTVPAGQRARLTQSHIRYDGTVAGVNMSLNVIVSSVQIFLLVVAPPVSTVFYPSSPDILLEAGDVVRCDITGATAGNDFYGAIALQRYK